MPKKKEEDDFFVGIEDPVELRRTVLEASKTTVETLQRYEKFKENKTKKIRHIESLKKTMTEIQKLNNKLKNILPKTKLRIPSELLERTKKEELVSEPEEKTDFEELSKELNDIEQKLSELEK